jgi:hypothetical protein
MNQNNSQITHDINKILKSEFSIVSHYSPILGIFVFP